MSEVRTLEAPPSLAAVFARAALTGRLRRGSALPATALRLEVDVDRDALTAYQQVCGFDVSDVVPHTYPHVLGFPLQAQLMAGRDFPLPMVGLVHLENAITARGRLTTADHLTVTVRAEGLRSHPKGRLVDLVTEVDAAGERVWEGRSTYLSRGRGIAGAERRTPAPAFPATGRSGQWRVPGDIGRRYGRVSGDVNPIHLHPLTARAMGFPSAIAHGMWTYARTLASLGRRAEGAVTSHVWFGKPVLLPSRVDLVVDTASEPLTAGLRSSRRPEVEHLVLTVEPSRA